VLLSDFLFVSEQLLENELPGPEAVGRLSSLGLATDSDAAGQVGDVDAGLDFVDILPAGARGFGESLGEIFSCKSLWRSFSNSSVSFRVMAIFCV
jgi:hypothetical protein